MHCSLDGFLANVQKWDGSNVKAYHGNTCVQPLHDQEDLVLRIKVNVSLTLRLNSTRFYQTTPDDKYHLVHRPSLASKPSVQRHSADFVNSSFSQLFFTGQDLSPTFSLIPKIIPNYFCIAVLAVLDIIMLAYHTTQAYLELANMLTAQRFPRKPELNHVCSGDVFKIADTATNSHTGNSFINGSADRHASISNGFPRPWESECDGCDLEQKYLHAESEGLDRASAEKKHANGFTRKLATVTGASHKQRDAKTQYFRLLLRSLKTEVEECLVAGSSLPRIVLGCIVSLTLFLAIKAFCLDLHSILLRSMRPPSLDIVAILNDTNVLGFGEHFFSRGSQTLGDIEDAALTELLHLGALGDFVEHGKSLFTVALIIIKYL